MCAHFLTSCLLLQRRLNSVAGTHAPSLAVILLSSSVVRYTKEGVAHLRRFAPLSCLQPNPWRIGILMLKPQCWMMIWYMYWGRMLSSV